MGAVPNHQPAPQKADGGRALLLVASQNCKAVPRFSREAKQWSGAVRQDKIGAEGEDCRKAPARGVTPEVGVEGSMGGRAGSEAKAEARAGASHARGN